VTASIRDDVRAWQTRPLEELYVVVYLDAMQVAIRDRHVVRKKAVYVAIGVTLEGTRDCLGLWIEKGESARFWTSVITELRNRGVKDVLFVCTDGLTDFPETIDAVFKHAVNQTRIVHLVRQSLRYLSYRERKPGTAAHLYRRGCRCRPPGARRAHERPGDSRTRTVALQAWERAWDRVIAFLAFPDEIHRVVYTINTVESLHMQIRKTIKTRGHFPTDDAALRLIWLAIQRAKTSWRTRYNRTNAIAVARIRSETTSPTTPNHPPIHRKTRRLRAARDAIRVGPQWLPIRGSRLQLEHLTLLDHPGTSSIDNEIEESHLRNDDDYPCRGRGSFCARESEWQARIYLPRPCVAASWTADCAGH
jgi:transposase-like protein